MDKTSMTLGYLVGKQIAGQRRTQERQPIAYLYNGVQLPPLPEWDRDMYPYAFMHKALHYQLWVGEEITYNGANIGIAGAYLHYYSDNAEWIELSGGTDVMICGIQDVEWANFDVLNSDGSVYLSASDPIPVYDLPT